jgi:sulfoxide reductase heme-binding subunit YedZ
MRIAEPYFSKLIKPLVFILALLPLVYLLNGVLLNTLGANPIESVIRDLGEWALRFLLLTLTISPLRRLTSMGQLLRLRRMLGLYVFFYASLHLIIYLWLEQSLDWGEIGLDILERPFITIGMLTFILLIPLAATSTTAAMRKLGKNWLRLHQLIYPIAIFAVLHFWWLVKADTQEPLIYALILTILLSERLIRHYGINKIINVNRR